MRKFLEELGLQQKKYVVYSDKSDIHRSKNLMFHSRLKLIDVRYHWIVIHLS